ncbi:MAG: hypothetical protein M3P51_04255 [Chloroflexota bacterium]|nr:hypothetical protein [Chloroflexota bacterium]
MGAGHAGIGIAAIWGGVAALTLFVYVPRLLRWAWKQTPRYKKELARLYRLHQEAHERYIWALREGDVWMQQTWEYQRHKRQVEIWEMQR